MSTQIGAVVQARIGSSRLRGKVLVNIAGIPLLGRVIERLGQSSMLESIVIATTTRKEDDAIARFSKSMGLPCFRGEENDVLSRFVDCAQRYNIHLIVRITGDCPLIDPEVIDVVIRSHLRGDADYTSNTLVRTFPRGLDVEVFSLKALQRADAMAEKPYQREHVTPCFYEETSTFNVRNVAARGALRRPDLRLTVDTREDLELVREIWRELGPGYFTIRDVIKLLDSRPDLRAINMQIKQKDMSDV